MLAAPVAAPAEPTPLELATLGAFSIDQDPAPSPAQAPVTTPSPPGRYVPGGEGEEGDVCPGSMATRPRPEGPILPVPAISASIASTVARGTVSPAPRIPTPTVKQVPRTTIPPR